MSTRYGRTVGMLKERRVAVSKVEENNALMAAPPTNRTEYKRAGEIKKLDVKQDQRWPVELTVTTA